MVGKGSKKARRKGRNGGRKEKREREGEEGMILTGIVCND